MHTDVLERFQKFLRARIDPAVSKEALTLMRAVAYLDDNQFHLRGYFGNIIDKFGVKYGEFLRLD